MSENEYHQIPIHELFVEHAYREDPTEDKVGRIAEKFDPLLIKTITVSPRQDGRYAIVNGVARVEAMRKLGMTQVMCKIEYDLDLAGEARRFRELNSS